MTKLMSSHISFPLMMFFSTFLHYFIYAEKVSNTISYSLAMNLFKPIWDLVKHLSKRLAVVTDNGIKVLQHGQKFVDT